MQHIILGLLKTIQRVIQKYPEYYHLNQKNDIRYIYVKEKIEIILSRFKNNKVFVCAFITACYTGMRTKEVFALTWEDIDLDNRIIKIKRCMQKIKMVFRYN